MKEIVMKWFNNQENLEYAKVTGEVSFYKVPAHAAVGDMLIIQNIQKINNKNISTGAEVFIINEIVNGGNDSNWPRTPEKPQVWGANCKHLGSVSPDVVTARIEALDKGTQRDLIYLFER